MATCRSRAMAGRPGPTWSATSRVCRRTPGSVGCRPATSTPGTAYATFDRHTFGDMTALSLQDSGLRQDLDAARHAAGGRRGSSGYAHVIKEDLVKPNLLFLGTEFGLYVSIDGGKTWAQFKGTASRRAGATTLRFSRATTNSFSRLTVAAFGSSTTSPLARAHPGVAQAKEAAFVAARPVQQRIEANGGWANGAAVFVGDNPPDAAVITYYQTIAPSLRQIEDRSARCLRPGGGRIAGEQAPRPQSCEVEHAREAAAGSAGRADRLRRHERSASSSRHLHRAHDQRRQSLMRRN